MVIKDLSSQGALYYIRGLVIRNAVEFSGHSMRYREALTDNIGTDEVKRHCGNLYRLIQWLGFGMRATSST
jgi:hypothetical protein